MWRSALFPLSLLLVLVLFFSTFKQVQKQTDFEKPFMLNLEWYDENSIDLARTASSLAVRSDVFAIIGPLYSDHVQIFAEQCFESKKPLIAPCASSESVIRAFSINPAYDEYAEPFLWSLTESDVSQVEALISKVYAYGGRSVSLISSADVYGKTFFDWLPFIAKELGVSLVQNVRYTSENTGEDYEAGTPALPLEIAVSEVFSDEADYVICALASYKDAGAVLDARETLGDSSPQLLFTGTAFTEEFADYGDKAEGVEGTVPYADSTTGFAVDYYARFGENLSYGEAHFYDALLVCGFAAAACISADETGATAFSNKTKNDAIRSVTQTTAKTPTWNLFGMATNFMLIDFISQLGITGATGSVCFDEETLTSAVRTVYAHWAVIQGALVPIDFTSSDGSGRTASNRASWEWSVQFDDTELEESLSASIDYDSLESRWAVIVAASKGWANYRHQADALYLYQLLKQSGYDDDHIILILADDIAQSARNKKPGEVFARLNGDNLYTEDISIDYLLSELTAENVAEILLGKQIDVDRSRENESHPYLATAPTVLESDTHADILWFWSGHGVNRRGDSTLGQFAWEGEGTQGFTTELMEETLASMSGQKRFRKMLVIAEPCYSASVLHVAEGIEGVLALTSANGSETSLADIYSVELKVWLSNRFTHNLTDTVASNDSVNYADLYKYLVQHTIGSHVQLFNADHFDNLYQTCPSEFFL